MNRIEELRMKIMMFETINECLNEIISINEHKIYNLERELSNSGGMNNEMQRMRWNTRSGRFSR